jgi:Tfp pilus assembly protein PilN
MATNEFVSAILWDGRRVEWTTLRRRKGSLEVSEQGRKDLPADPEQETQGPLGAEELRACCGSLKGDLTLGIPTHQTLLRAADLPSVDPDELESMVELQVDKFSPFPVEHMAVTYERTGGTDTTSRVLIAAAKLESVNDRAALGKQAGLNIRRVDVAALGWWQLIYEANAIPPKGRHALLLLDLTGSELIVLQDGLPVAMRSLDAQSHATEDEFATEIAEEVAYTLTSLETEWGAIAVPEVTLWHRDAPPDRIADHVRQSCEVNVHMRSLEDLPPLTEGLARRAASGSDVMDLLPASWHDAERQHTRRKRMIAATITVAALWLIGVGAFFAVMHVDAKRIETLRADIEAIEKPAEAVRELRGRVEDLEQYADRTYSALETLREVSALLPNGMELLSFAYRKGQAINVRGQARDVNLIFDFVESMEQSPLFTEVEPEGITEAPGGRRLPEFRLSAQLPGDES